MLRHYSAWAKGLWNRSGQRRAALCLHGAHALCDLLEAVGRVDDGERRTAQHSEAESPRLLRRFARLGVCI